VVALQETRGYVCEDDGRKTVEAAKDYLWHDIENPDDISGWQGESIEGLYPKLYEQVTAEVKLNQEVKAGSGGEEKAFEEMDEKIDTFMKKHEWAFPMGKGDTLTGKAKLDWGCERVHGLFDDNFLYCGGMMRADK
jgi:hypothetical protein